MKRVKKYKAIQIALRMEGYSKQDIANRIGRSLDYITKRFCLHEGKSFMIEEIYLLLDMAGIPRNKIFEYFPPSGQCLDGPRLKERSEAV